MTNDKNTAKRLVLQEMQATLFNIDCSSQLKKRCCFFLLALSVLNFAIAQKNVFPIVTQTSKVAIVYNKDAPKLDSISANLLADDIERVTGYKPKVTNNINSASGNVIILGAVQSPIMKKIIRQTAFSNKLQRKWECFGYTIVDKPVGNIIKAFVIAGSDTRGTAYGVFTLSEKIGVSPWYWWADVSVKHRRELLINQPDFISSPPAVKFRGIFINDEDWGLQPWAAKTFEPETGDIGPKTYAKVFELLLRLKANLIWPAMHPSTKAFFHYPGNPQMAADYQIVVGSSHAEPMLRNNVGEWDVTTMGDFNYFTNKEKILQYWEDRVKESKGLDAIYSIGMRGVHDGQMEGIKDLKDAVPIIEKIIQEQRELLLKYINRDITSIPQVLTPYKEVLEIYDNGLKVPDDVTLVWPDDNYGYITRLNNEKEKARKGGAGVYYHASYWGRPHDYLWLPSTHPSLVREEMLKAYESGADRLWVLNVGDIKPQEYNMQQFLDIAFNPIPFKDSRYTKRHLQHWVNGMFGHEKDSVISEILWEYYDLAFERRPEFMGWSQTEPTTKTTYTGYNHFFYGDEAQQRIDRYNKLAEKVKNLRKHMNSLQADAFYELVYYPVIGAALINKKFLYRDKAYLYAKQNRASANDYNVMSQQAYDDIVKETAYYNNKLASGKWRNMMSMAPRDLPVYQEPDLPQLAINKTGTWSIAPEGFVTADSSLITSKSASFSLPAFNRNSNKKYFVDVFLSDDKSVSWVAKSEDWISLSQRSGTLSAHQGKRESRIWVSIDWKKISHNGVQNGLLRFTAAGKNLEVNIIANNAVLSGLNGYKGSIEDNGLISISAADFSRKDDRQNQGWSVINGLGSANKTLEARVQPGFTSMSGNAESLKTIAPFVEYDFYSLTSASPVVLVYTLPTHPINTNYSMRYAVSIDDGTLQVVDFKTVGRSEEWKQNVLSNSAIRKIQAQAIDPGKHTLRIYMIDPGVIMDRILIDFGGYKNAYSNIPGSKY